MPNKLYVVGNTEQRFKKGVYDKTIFETLPIIFREEGSGTRVVMEKFISKNNLPIHKKMELTSNEAVKQAVIAGLGYSIMPLIGIKNELINKDVHYHKAYLKGMVESNIKLGLIKSGSKVEEKIKTQV
jgi:DNA-binding transcriptional LysR family regulator